MMSTIDIAPNIRRHVDDLGETTGMLSSLVIYTLVGSILGFQCYNSALNFVPCPEKYNDEKNRFKWRNIMASFLHASISGCSSVYILYSSPEILSDLINNYNVRCEVLVALSTGYFVYDFFDIIKYKKLSDTWPLLIHHVVIFCCFGISMYSKHYLGYTIVSLTAEVNSIFLHGRQLQLMLGTSKTSAFFVVNKVVNIITFVLCRFGVLLWMAWWLQLNMHLVPTVLVLVATIGLITMLCGNVVLFYKLLMSDFIPNRNRQPKDNNISQVKEFSNFSPCI